MTQYPRWFVPVLLLAMLALLLSGALLTPTTLALRAEVDLPWRASGASRVWIAALHAGAGFVLAALLGALWSVHMRSGWRRQLQRASGATLAAAFTLLVVTALALYYLGDDRLAALAAFTHLGLGVAVCALFAWHALRGRAMRLHARPHRLGHRPR